MTGITDVKNWISAFERSRGNVAFGNPLWAYKVTDKELQSLQRLLKELFSVTKTENVFGYYINSLDKALVIYLATWLQRNFQGGIPKWNEVLASIGIVYSQTIRSDLTNAVRSGLKKWGVSVFATDTSNRYLATLYCHGGFPRADLVGESKTYLMDYFDAVLMRYSNFSYSDKLEVIALDELRRLPQSLQQHPFSDLAVALINYLIDLRDRHHLYIWENPFALLDSQQPNWREDIPFLVIDEEAEKLINKLLHRTSQMVRRSQTPVRVKRTLKVTADSLQLCAHVHINHTIHPDDLSRSLNCLKLPSHFEISTITSDDKRHRTASCSYRSGIAPRWMVSTQDTMFMDKDAINHIDYRIYADGQSIASGTYCNGEALNLDVPWAFDTRNDPATFIGQGNIKTHLSSVVVVSKTSPIPCSAVSHVKQIGSLSILNYGVYSITGHVKLPSKVGDYHVRTETEEVADYSLTVRGEEYSLVTSDLPVYRGTPEISQSTNSDPNVLHSELVWITEKNKTPLITNNPQIVGVGSIVWLNDGEALWHKRCLILPKDFCVELTHDKNDLFILKLTNLGNAKIGMTAGQETWLISKPEKIDNFYLCRIKIPTLLTSSVSILVDWHSDNTSVSTLKFPIGIDSVTLTDRKDRPYREHERGNLILDDLYQMKVWVRSQNQMNNFRVKAELLSGERIVATCSEEIKLDGIDGLYVADGRSLAGVAARLLRHGTLPDNNVVLTFYNNKVELKTQFPLIHRYKHNPHFDRKNNKIIIKNTPHLSSAAQVKLYLSPIWDMKRQPLLLAPAMESNAIMKTYEIPSVREYGDWMLWASADTSIQPRILNFEVPIIEQEPKSFGTFGQQFRELLIKKQASNPEIYREVLQEGTLEHAVKYLQVGENTQHIDFKFMNKIIRDMGNDINHPGWLYVESLLELTIDIEPGTFYVLKRIMGVPGTLVLMLLRNEKHFGVVWGLADRLPFEWTAIPFKAWENAICKVVEHQDHSLGALRDTYPDVFEKLIDQYLSPLSEKGEYFKTIVDLIQNRKSKLTGICPVEVSQDIYENQNIYGGQLIAARSDFYSRHGNQMMCEAQCRRNDKELIDALEQIWSINSLPIELRCLFQKFPPQDTKSEGLIRAKKLTTEIPLWVAFNNMNLFAERLPGKIWAYLNFALSELQQFDRYWLNKSMSLAICAASAIRKAGTSIDNSSKK